MKNIVRILAFLLLPFYFANAQSGVLIPSLLNQNGKPDDSVLSLHKIDVDILLDNQHANVKIVQIFNNKTGQTLEGKYLFALPKAASIFDFATWENDLRLPGVMMEKRRADGIYAALTAPQIDPAILQQDEETAAFSAKVFPINPYGTKRLELEYSEDLSIDNLISRFSFPLKASFGEMQKTEELNIRLRVTNDFPFTPIELKGYEMQVLRDEPHEYEAIFNAKNIELKEDLSFAYRIETESNSLSLLAYRAPEKISVYDLKDPANANRNPDGFFEARAIFNQDASHKTNPKKVILILDTSLSMYGDKLLRAMESLDYFLHNLKETDEFNLLLFNSESILFSEKSLSATTANIEKALQFVKRKSIGGGTNLKKALQTAIANSKYFPGEEADIVLISDANPTLETTKTSAIESIFSNHRVRLFAFAIGTDTNDLLLKELCDQTKGDFLQVRETDDISLNLKIFLEKIGSEAIGNLRFTTGDEANLYQIYANEGQTFFGSSISFVGRYKEPRQTEISVSGNFTGALTKAVDLPKFDETHGFLPRVWAKARVNALLQAINIEGEREDYIAEIIHLSEKYKFVTPYTAFIAAPRALLRPRLIQPGDPVIRIKTDPSIKEVFAVLPFGETLPLKFLPAEGVWETRFLAPANMADGVYKCRILLTDQAGNGYQEEKTFVIDANAPDPKIKLDKKTFHAGEEILVKVSSDRDTAQIFAKLYGAKPTRLSWSNQEKINIGKLPIPQNLAAGKYVLTVTATDFAHNLSTIEMEIEIL